MHELMAKLNFLHLLLKRWKAAAAVERVDRQSEER